VTDPRGNATLYRYDANNNLVEIQDANGGTVAFTYDAVNNLASITDPEGNTTRFEYDSRNRVVKTIDPAGRVSGTEYDPAGNVTATTDARGQRIEYVYDVMNRLVKKILPGGHEINYVYDAAGNLPEVTDQIGTIRYEYDAGNRLTKATYPSGQSVAYTYDPVGNRKTLTYPSGRTVQYSYDGLNRLSTVAPSNIPGAFTFGYDNAGRRTSLSYPNGVLTAYDYDDANRLTRILSRKDTDILADIGYTHDLNGNRLTRSTLLGTQAFTYDNLNQVIRAVYESGNLEEFVYDNNGNREKHITRESPSADPVTTLSTFNNLNQLLSSEIEGADGSSEGSTHIRGRVVDKNVESVTVNGMIATIEGETYTVEDLTLQPGENAVQVVAVDKAGNTTSETFTLFFDPKARATYRYDLNGNLIQKTEKGVVWRYAWDAENRLIRVRKATTEGAESTEIEYAYYDNGNRAWKRVTEAGKDPVITNYVHDGIHVIAEYNGEGELLKEYVYSDNIDEVLSSKTVIPDSDPKSSITNYYHQDGLNSVVAVTDADGERVASYNYEAFGTIKDATGALGNPITYTGRWIEPETGDYFYRARYYDSSVGRFLKKDPIGFKSKDYNLYRYVGNDSIKHIDSWGLERISGTWISGPKYNVTGFGINNWKFVRPSFSKWGFLKAVQLYGTLKGYVNIDVKCKCGDEVWEIHKRMNLNIHGSTRVGFNLYAAGAGYLGGPWIGIGVWGMMLSGAALEFEYELLQKANAKAGPIIKLLMKKGPKAICIVSSKLRKR
jgi:RHS repeat-associated protein